MCAKHLELVKQVQYDTMHYILTFAQKWANSQLNLPHWTKQKRAVKKLKTKKKPRCAEETVQSWSPWSQCWGRKRVYDGIDLGKICERGQSWSERERELWMVRVVSWQSEKVWSVGCTPAYTGKLEAEGVEWGWRRELGSRWTEPVEKNSTTTDFCANIACIALMAIDAKTTAWDGKRQRPPRKETKLLRDAAKAVVVYSHVLRYNNVWHCTSEARTAA